MATSTDLPSSIILNNTFFMGDCDDFDRIQYLQCNYEDFFKNYLNINKPCVISGVSENWKCQKEWIRCQKPNFDILFKNYGKASVPVSDCANKYFNSQRKEIMIFSKYIDYWKNYISSGYPKDDNLLYLKDWHFCKDFQDNTIYEVPLYFASDWLNEFYLGFPDLDDDYRFVYMGPKGTWTPLHKDVFSSYSWSVNICGIKEWIFYPPGEEKYLKDDFGNLMYDVREPDVECKFRNSSKASYITLVQSEGDAVFVPSGWYHQVTNKEDTISVNHNWVNACNINIMYQSMLEELKLVEKELSDCTGSSDWSEMCQRLLRASFGWNLTDFLKFLGYIITRRVTSLKSEQPLNHPNGYCFGKNHVELDLRALVPLLKSFINFNNYCDQATAYLTSVENVL